VLLHAIVGHQSLDEGAVVPPLWPPGPARAGPTHRRIP
jgi:hypothetical protein